MSFMIKIHDHLEGGAIDASTSLCAHPKAVNTWIKLKSLGKGNFL